eukprot:scaffold421192_cov59-Attheya_sp.AAC.1
MWTQTSIPGVKTKFREAENNLRNKIRIAKSEWHDRKAEEVHKMPFNPKSAWEAIREIQAGCEGHHNEQTEMKMNMENGEKATTDKDNADVMGNHFSKVFNNHRPIDSTVIEEIKQREIRTELGDPPTVAEVANAIRKVANGKAPGEAASRRKL